VSLDDLHLFVYYFKSNGGVHMLKGELVKFEESIQDRIYSIRGYQVMLAGVLKSETAVKVSRTKSLK